MKKVFFIFLLTLFILPLSHAGINYCAEAKISDITPSSIEINEEFTVGVQIENCGENVANNAVFKILNPSEYIEIKEPLTMNIGDIYYANSQRHITYNMKTTPDAKPGKYVLNAQLIYGPENSRIQEDYNITFKVIGEEAELNIASIQTSPTIPEEDEEIDLTIRIENFGEGNAHSVKVVFNHPFEGNKEAFIGTLDSDEESPAIFSFIPNKGGEFNVPLEIIYEDDFGKHTISEKINITIMEKGLPWKLIFLGIGVFFLIIFLYFYNKKHKSDSKNGQKK